MPVYPEDLARTLLRRAASRIGGDERDRAACLRDVERLLPELRETLGFGRAWLIGSLAWGRFGLRSDVDLVVEGAPAGAAVTISDRVGSATGRVVDVLELERLPPAFRQRVLAEGLRVA